MGEHSEDRPRLHQSGGGYRAQIIATLTNHNEGTDMEMDDLTHAESFINHSGVA
ncbi:unnamed protein product [Arctogadus glacialis]